MDRYIPDRLPFSKKILPVRVILSYIFDYAIIVVLGIIYTAIDRIVKPFNQHFSLRNYTIQYPYAERERVPIMLAGVIAVLIPMLVIAIYTLILDGIFSHRRKQTGTGWSSTYRLKDRLWELNCGILGLLLSEGAAFVITGSLKNLCGKPRPDLIARCRPSDGAVDAPVFGLSNSTICTQTDQAIMADGFRSFPSGHSSSAFAGLFYLSLYLAAKLHVLDNRGEVWRTFIVLIPTLAASCIAMSRIMDARHHPFDILFGSALGMLVAWAAYRQYFPPVSETWKKGRAYPIRTWGMEIKGPPMVGNEIVQKPTDMEPYRTRGPTLPPTVEPSAVHQHSETGNVFRDQISRSQRQRTDRQPGHNQNPYYTTADGTRYTSPRVRDEDDDWTATSSEDDVYRTRAATTNAVARVPPEEFEMQRPPNMASVDAERNVGVEAGNERGDIRHALPLPRIRADDMAEEDTEYKTQGPREMTGIISSPTQTQTQTQTQAQTQPRHTQAHPGERVLA